MKSVFFCVGMVFVMAVANLLHRACAQPERTRVAHEVLKFPTEFSAGRLFRAKINSQTGAVECERLAFSDARGEVRIPAGSFVRLKVGFAAVAQPGVFVKVAPGAVIVLDCRSLDNLNDDALQYLAHFSSTAVMALDETDVTDKGIAQLKTMKNLSELSLKRTLVSGKVLAHLKPFTKLHSLALTNNKLNDVSLANLAALKELKEVDFSANGLTDAAFEGLPVNPTLLKLNLSNNRHLSDRCLSGLKKFTGLQRLELVGTQITPDGLLQLKSLPLRHIVWDLDRQPEHVRTMIENAFPDCKFSAASPSKTPLEIFAPLR